MRWLKEIWDAAKVYGGRGDRVTAWSLLGTYD